MDLLLVQIAILFLPGLIWTHIDRKYASYVDYGGVEFAVKAFLFGVFSYAVLFVIYDYFGFQFSPAIDGVGNASYINFIDFYDEIIASIPVALILSVFWVYMSTYKIVPKFLQLIKATKRYGDEDVWGLILNSNDASSEYLHFRDFENELTYAGWVKAFSEGEEIREILLRDVIVFDFEGQELYRSPLIYIAKDKNKMMLELPYIAGSQAREQSGGDDGREQLE